MKKNNGKTTLEMKLMETLARKVHNLEIKSKETQNIVAQTYQEIHNIFGRISKDFKKLDERIKNLEKMQEQTETLEDEQSERSDD